MGASESTGQSNGKESGGGFSEAAATAVAIAAGVAFANWVASRLFPDNTDSEEKDDAMAIKAPNPKGESSGYGGIRQDYGVYTGSEVAKQPSNWHPPPRGRFKMNTSAVSGPKPGQSAYAGILRNDGGEWVRGFVGIGVGEIQTAEMCAIFTGLKLLDELGLKASILESGSDDAVFLIKKKGKSPNMSYMISECSRLAVKNKVTIDTDNGDDANQCAHKLADMALTLQEEYFEIKELPRGIKHLVDKDKESKAYKGKSIWHLPLRGRYKMNTDGACKPNPRGPGGYGGILRDGHGEFVCCFYGFIDRRSDGLTAEFHGILRGLRLLNRPCYKRSILETDCQPAYEWVTNRKDGSSKSKIISDCRDIITECIELIYKNEIVVRLIRGKHANRCADKLAAMALKKEDQVYMKFEHVPRDIKSFVDEDKKTHGLLVPL